MSLRTLLPCLALALAVPVGCADTEAPDAHPALTPPATAESAFEIHLAPFDVDPGSERQVCYFFEVPHDAAVFVDRISATQTSGSHHMNVFRVKTIKDLGVGAKSGDVVEGLPCWKSPNWADWPLVVNSQIGGELDWKLPDGVAHRFEPREMLMVQSHFVNATTQKTSGVAKVDLKFQKIEAARVTDELGTAFATNQNITVCPGQQNASVEASCQLKTERPITIVGANGHFHSRGTRFSMTAWDPQQGAMGAPFYDTKNWAEPLMAHDLRVPLQPGQGFSYKCEYAVPADACGDPNQQCCFTFGPKVETNEHCNAFVYYYPKGSTDIRCF
jgi:hypothetical protein